MTRIRAPTTKCGRKDSKELCPAVQGFPLPEPWSCRGTLPRTLVFGSVGDHTDAVESWFGPNGHRRGYEVAIVYYGKDRADPGRIDFAGLPITLPFMRAESSRICSGGSSGILTFCPDWTTWWWRTTTFP